MVRKMLIAGCTAAVLPFAGGAAGPEGLGELPFLTGGDISMLARFEELGAVFRRSGEATDFLTLVRESGWTCCRLRLFVRPNMENAVINDLAYTVALGKRVKQAGMTFLLDIHYSDTWADPGHQDKPAEWAELPFPALVRTVEAYTGSVLDEFRRAGAAPDIVQVGNEISPGFLWPDGKLGGDDPLAQWGRFTELVKAGIRGVRSVEGGQAIRVMIHTDKGGDPGAMQWFFGNLLRRDVRFDMIGLSFYPWWHGGLESVAATLERAAGYGKPIVVVETAYPRAGAEWWNEKPNLAYPITPEGQARFLTDLVATVRRTPAGCGAGVLYWYPEAIPIEGLKVWNGGSTALFDAAGNAMPGVGALRAVPAGE